MHLREGVRVSTRLDDFEKELMDSKRIITIKDDCKSYTRQGLRQSNSSRKMVEIVNPRDQSKAKLDKEGLRVAVSATKVHSSSNKSFMSRNSSINQHWNRKIDKDCQVSTANRSDSSKFLVGVMDEIQQAERAFLNEINHNQSQASLTTVKPFYDSKNIVIKKSLHEKKRRVEKQRTNSLA